MFFDILKADGDVVLVLLSALTFFAIKHKSSG